MFYTEHIRRTRDVILAAAGLLMVSPVLLPLMAMIWRQDGYSPVYWGRRIGKEMQPFNMLKLRSMTVGADKSGVVSTSVTDRRITPIGHFVRRTKLDEMMQLWNVVIGDMSLVGPRPNVQEETQLYSSEERRLLSVRPGITDLASIVFSDEGEILRDAATPDLLYSQLIRPWKSRLGLFYVTNRSLRLDLRILWLTAVSLLDRQAALDGVNRILVQHEADSELVRVARRAAPLVPCAPPGAAEIVTQR